MTRIAFLGASASEEKYFLHHLPDQTLSFYRNDQWQLVNPATEILSIFVDFDVTPAVFAHLPKLKMIMCRSAGFNNIDPATVKERGIIVANTPGYGASSVAEYAFALMLVITRRLTTVISNTSEGTTNRNIERGFDLNGQTLGIVGCGAIGRGLAPIAKGAGMRVIGYDPFWNAEWADSLGVEKGSLDDIFRESDVVSLHMPYTAQNHHLLDKKAFDAMKKDALLVNTARGELVDTVAMLEALHSGRLGGAALDVIEEEDLLGAEALNELVVSADEDDPTLIQRLKVAAAIFALRQMPNVIVTNHNAFNTVEAINRINEMTVTNAQSYVSGNVDDIFRVCIP